MVLNLKILSFYAMHYETPTSDSVRVLNLNLWEMPASLGSSLLLNKGNQSGTLVMHELIRDFYLCRLEKHLYVCLWCVHRLSLPDTALGKTAPQTCRFLHIWCFHSKLIYLIYFPIFFFLHHKLLTVKHFNFPSLSHALNSCKASLAAQHWDTLLYLTLFNGKDVERITHQSERVERPEGYELKSHDLHYLIYTALLTTDIVTKQLYRNPDLVLDLLIWYSSTSIMKWVTYVLLISLSSLNSGRKKVFMHLRLVCTWPTKQRWHVFHTLTCILYVQLEK